ncbi:nucleotidyltransferase [Gemmatimonas sp.]|uniref:nucleotidyltransferase domain-containing protein n=1 Tax=Gemmatimonas sp. TaxID=1962908 RepID=UPI00356A0EF3
MNIIASRATQLWTLIAEELDIAPSLYEKASARHVSVGEWLCRPSSPLAVLEPRVHSQGSFRYGTVIKPLVADATYDLDNVVVFTAMQVTTMSQEQLKRRFGDEIAAYARAHQMQEPIEKGRCWRLPYRDEVSFHLDALPSVPAARATQLALRDAGVEDDWARRAVAITDLTHADYRVLSTNWLTSNPRGFARWFESRAALGRSQPSGVRAGVVEDVPPYQWKTPLQRAIQIFKRHRDVMFARQPELAPISMIITNLAAHAYDGERDLGEALRGIVSRMGRFVRPVPPRVPNPTHPREDYADKWRRDSRLSMNFDGWLSQLRADVMCWDDPFVPFDPALVSQRFAVQLSSEQQQRLAPSAPLIMVAAATPRVQDAPRPWGR